MGYRIVNIVPQGKVLREPSSETAQWPVVVLMAPAEDVAVESGEREVSANAANAASIAAAMAARRNPDVFMFKSSLLLLMPLIIADIVPPRKRKHVQNVHYPSVP